MKKKSKTNARKPLTPRQAATLKALVLFTEEHHRQPSYAEMRSLIGKADVRHNLLELEVRGWIVGTGQARAIEIPSDVYEAIVKNGEVPEVEE